MRLIAAFALIGITAAHAQDASETSTNTNCLERLRLPVYPKLADLARIQGTLTASVKLTAEGSIERIILDIGKASAEKLRLFQPAVEEALRASTFRGGCGGKTVTLVFIFQLSEELDPNGLSQRLSFGFPNRFWISVPPKVIQ